MIIEKDASLYCSKYSTRNPTKGFLQYRSVCPQNTASWKHHPDFNGCLGHGHVEAQFKTIQKAVFPILLKQEEEEKKLIWEKMTDEWCKGSAPWALPTLTAWKQGASRQRGSQWRKSSEHEMPWRNAQQSLPGMIPTLIPPKVSSEFPGWESSFWPAPADIVHLHHKNTDLPPLPTCARKSKHSSTVGVWAAAFHPAQCCCWAAGWEQTSISLLAGQPSAFCCLREGRLVAQHSEQRANLSFKGSGNESPGWGVGFSSSFCHLLLGWLHMVFRHFRQWNPRWGFVPASRDWRKWRSHSFSCTPMCRH